MALLLEKHPNFILSIVLTNNKYESRCTWTLKCLADCVHSYSALSDQEIKQYTKMFQELGKRENVRGCLQVVVP